MVDRAVISDHACGPWPDHFLPEISLLLQKGLSNVGLAAKLYQPDLHSKIPCNAFCLISSEKAFVALLPVLVAGTFGNVLFYVREGGGGG